MNTNPHFSPKEARTNVPLLIILALVLLGTLLLAAPLAALSGASDGTGYSAPTLFNQANAYAAQGKIGLAILTYERARLLAPTDPDIAANLQLVRQHAGLPDANSGWLDRAVSWASPNTFAIMGAVGLLLTGAGILSARSFSRFQLGFNLAVWTGIALMALSVLSAISTWQCYHQAVVIAEQAPARISPVTNGETSFTLQPGEMVSVTGNYRDFDLVQNQAGHSGWVAASEMTQIIPR